MRDKLIVFVCTENICRSPMAEYLLRHRLPPDTRWDVQSAGIYATDGSRPSYGSLQAMAEMKIDISRHRSQSLGGDLVDAATLIVVMTTGHRDHVRKLFPHADEKTFLIKSFDRTAPGGSVADPIGGSVDFYRSTREEINAAIPGLLEFLGTLERPDMQ